MAEKLEVKRNDRGFAYAEIEDSFGVKGTIQESSLDTGAGVCIWLGVDDPEIEVFDVEGDGQWHKHELPEGALVRSRLHLNQEKAAQLLPLLKKFVKTGYL